MFPRRHTQTWNNLFTLEAHVGKGEICVAIVNFPNFSYNNRLDPAFLYVQSQPGKYHSQLCFVELSLICIYWDQRNTVIIIVSYCIKCEI